MSRAGPAWAVVLPCALILVLKEESHESDVARYPTPRLQTPRPPAPRLPASRLLASGLPSPGLRTRCAAAGALASAFRQATAPGVRTVRLASRRRRGMPH